MAYDEVLADRIREVLQDESGITEQKMFGGLGFMVHGNMAVAAGSSGGLMIRNDPARADDAVATGEVDRMVMRGKPMDGWLLAPADGVDSDEALERWVRHGLDYAKTLPPK